MFYDTFIFLCDQRGLSPSKAATDAKISKSLVTKWKTNGTESPSPDVLMKLSRFFGVTPDYLLGYDIQSKLDIMSLQIKQLKNEIATAPKERRDDLESTLFALTESYDDLLLARSLEQQAERNKKSSLSERALSKREQEFLELFRELPPDHQPAAIAMMRTFIQTISTTEIK